MITYYTIYYFYEFTIWIYIAVNAIARLHNARCECEDSQVQETYVENKKKSSKDVFNDVYGLNDVGTLKKTKLGKPAVCDLIYIWDRFMQKKLFEHFVFHAHNSFLEDCLVTFID